MTPERDFTHFMPDIRDNALSATSFVRDMSFKEFEHDLPVLQSVFQRLIEEKPGFRGR